MVDDCRLEAAGPGGSEAPPQAERCGQVGPADVLQLIGDHYAALYRYAFRLAGSQADAEDLTQQTFLVAHQKLHQLRAPDKADRWLFAVLRSCYLKSERKRRPVAAASVALDVECIPEEMPTDAPIDRQQLQAALDELPCDFRVVLAMFYFEQRSYREIAEELNVPIGTVMSRLSRAKERLRRGLLSGETGPGPLGERNTRTRRGGATAVEAGVSGRHGGAGGEK